MCYSVFFFVLVCLCNLIFGHGVSLLISFGKSVVPRENFGAQASKPRSPTLHGIFEPATFPKPAIILSAPFYLPSLFDVAEQPLAYVVLARSSSGGENGVIVLTQIGLWL